MLREPFPPSRDQGSVPAEGGPGGSGPAERSGADQAAAFPRRRRSSKGGWPTDLSIEEADVEQELAVRRERTASLSELYAAHAPRAGRLAFLLTRDAALAEDVAQEAFARLIVRLPSVRNPDAIDAYLRRCVVNLCRKQWRRLSRERSFLQREGPAVAGRVTSLPDVASQHDLRRALDRLPYRQRAALVLRFYEDLSEKEAARSLGCAVGTIKSLTSRGLATLREELDDEDAD